MKLEQAEKMAKSLMRHHGVYGYKFSFMQRRKRFNTAGSCNWRTKTMRLAPVFVEMNHVMLVKQVILHEIAHALRPKHGHNRFFQKTATSLGCTKYKGRKSHTYYGSEVKR